MEENLWRELVAYILYSSNTVPIIISISGGIMIIFLGSWWWFFGRFIWWKE